MYRKLVMALTGALVLGVVLRTYMVSGPIDPGDTHLQALMGQLQAWGLFRFRSEGGLAFVSLLKNLLGFGLALVLIRAGACHPGRKVTALPMLLHGAASGAAVAYAFFFLYDTVNATGLLAALYGRQTGQNPVMVIAAALPHRLLEGSALLLILAAPLFVLIRSLQVLSLKQASFEGWLEARRRWRWAVALLLAAAVMEVYVSPAVTAYLVR